MTRSLYLIALLFCCHWVEAQVVEKTKQPTKKLYPLTITFQHQVDSLLLSLDSTYVNEYRETFQVRNFRYYISHIVLSETNGKKWELPQTYFLIDERKPESKFISFQIPFSKIQSIQFSVGVDSAKNVSGVQTGALDPANGMFWTWNSGYIFAKLEGTSPQSKAPGHNFTYHIGGFRSGENAIRFIDLPVAKTLSPNENNIIIMANVNSWFGNGVDILTLPSMMQPGNQALQIADNYSKMFSVEK